MIVDLPGTTTSAVNRALIDLRDRGGAVALGRVLTLVVVADDSGSGAEDAIEAANAASSEHPCRVIVVVRGAKRGASRLDAQIRVGGDAGASEVLVLRLYGPLAAHSESVVVPMLLPDAPIVAWWPSQGPDHPAADPIGAMAQRRITDAAQSRTPLATLRRRSDAYAEGDTDVAWTRTTLWRGLLAAALDLAPFEPVTSATVSGAADSPSTDLLAAWLARTLKCPVTRARGPRGSGIRSVRLDRRSGPVELVRPDGNVATLTQPGQPERRVSLPRRGLAECLSEELRRLDWDEVYAETLAKGLPLLAAAKTTTQSQAERAGDAPDLGAARRRQRKVGLAQKKTSEAIRAAEPSAKKPGPARKTEKKVAR